MRRADLIAAKACAHRQVSPRDSASAAPPSHADSRRPFMSLSDGRAGHQLTPRDAMRRDVCAYNRAAKLATSMRAARKRKPSLPSPSAGTRMS